MRIHARPPDDDDLYDHLAKDAGMTREQFNTETGIADEEDRIEAVFTTPAD